jgi:hypothetical protein
MIHEILNIAQGPVLGSFRDFGPFSADEFSFKSSHEFIEHPTLPLIKIWVAVFISRYNSGRYAIGLTSLRCEKTNRGKKNTFSRCTLLSFAPK